MRLAGPHGEAGQRLQAAALELAEGRLGVCRGRGGKGSVRLGLDQPVHRRDQVLQTPAK